MSVKFETVLDGTAKYIDKYICGSLNDWQDIMIHMVMGRIFDNRESIKNMLINNGFARAFAVIDEGGNIDIERLLQELKTELQRKEKLVISVPFMGKLTFIPADVDTLKKIIMEGSENENNENT